MDIFNILFYTVTVMLILHWNWTNIGWHAIVLASAMTATIRIAIFAGFEPLPASFGPDPGLWEAFTVYLVGVPLLGILHGAAATTIIIVTQFRFQDRGFRLMSLREKIPEYI